MSTPPSTPSAVSPTPPGARTSFLDRLLGMPERSLDRWIIASICLLVGVVFFHTLEGDWVYDDGMQIVGNPLIKDPALYKQALLSDVWSFRSTGGEAGSRYWRPTFVAWMIVHYRAFGLGDAIAWHASTVLTHMLASVLAFMVSRRLGLAPLLAAAVAVIFALHPSRVESVAWISGVTDPILAVLLFGMMLLLMAMSDRVAKTQVGGPSSAASERGSGGRGATGVFAYLRTSPIKWAALLFLYALALGSKEVAAMFPIIVVVLCLRWQKPDKAAPARLVRSSVLPAIGAAIPFVLMAVAYLMIRWEILGPDPDLMSGKSHPFVVSIYTLPRVGLFYIVQGLFPFRISPVYDLAHVMTPTFDSFFLPGLALVCIGLLMLWLVLGPARGRITSVGMTIFVCIIAPAGYSSHFPPDYLVHDRYLYIPLLGLLLMVLGLVTWCARRVPDNKFQIGVLAFSTIAMSLLGWQTLRYGDAWKSNLTIWQWGYREMPNSQFAIHHYAIELLGRATSSDSKAYSAEAGGRVAEAASLRSDAQKDRREAEKLFARSIDLSPSGISYLAMADAFMGDERYDDAERMLKMVLNRYHEVKSFPPEYVYALDSLARVYLERDDNLDAAVAVYRPAIDVAPSVVGRLYDRMAMVTIRWAQLHQPPVQTERWEQARTILEEGLSKVDREVSSESRMLRFRLGQVYAQQGRLDDAARLFTEFMSQTEGFEERMILEARDVAERTLVELAKMKKAP